ncbi:MAG: cell wall biogenesis protein [Candidatus Pelagibacter sp. TMED197]|nr:MAG: cell wall biogenesis protein [Candidatus Pelagibacter sp. TMED197]|tara:strand:+ start:246 stop:1373 length:1128 start_codon:yes stop_codon:yes gene_type:complete
MSFKVPFVSIDRQFKNHSAELTDAFIECARSGQYILGEKVEMFETELAKICGSKFCITVGNGTDALVISLKLLNISKNDEVILPVNSFIATAGSIIACGAKPVFCDIDETLNIDYKKIEDCISEKTKAIMPVHLTGRPANFNKIKKIAHKYNLKIIEDAAQAIGAKYYKNPVGSLGNIAAFSLHPLKNFFIMGDGGFITTDDFNYYERGKTLRNHGLINRDIANEWGFNSRLDAIHCSIGLKKLKYFEETTKRFRYIASIYTKNLKGFVKVPEEKDYEFSVYHNFVIQTPFRNKLMQFLNVEGIETKIHYPVPLHLQPAAKNLGYRKGDFPIAEKINLNQLSLPIYPEISDTEIYLTINKIKEFFIKQLNDKEVA